MFENFVREFEPIPTPVLILRSPLKYLVATVHCLLVFLRPGPRPINPAIRIVCISDSHDKTTWVPDGDVLIHAGDLTNDGTPKAIQKQIKWLNSMPHRYKVCIAGNHDTWLDPRSRKHLSSPNSHRGSLDWLDVIYLEHSSKTLYFPNHAGRRLKLYGGPQIPACGGPEFAFQYPRGADAWSDTIPVDTDVLITHTPPLFHRDLATAGGCRFLLQEIWKVRPILHVCGHVHAGYGREKLFWDSAQQAFERASDRSDGLVSSAFNVLLWWNLVEVIVYNCLGLIWGRVWGGRQDACRLVNASLTYRNTGRLDNRPQVIML